MANLITLLPLFIFFSLIISPPPATSFNNHTDFLSLLAFKSAIDLDPLGALASWNQTTHFCEWNGIRCGRRHPDRVVEINLMSQALVGSLSPHIGNLSLLKSISLHNNSFHGTIPQHIGHLRKLRYLGMSNNSFNGPIHQNLSRCSDLVYLNLNNNALSGYIPPELELLQKLEVLYLSVNRLSGPFPPSLGNLTSLEQISLAECQFHGEIPESFTRLKSLKFLQFAANNLTGTIPIGLFNMSQLFHFAVDTNHLQGTIPSYIGYTLPKLQYLILAQNRFAGPLPLSLSNLSNLINLQMPINGFTGRIPQLGRCSNLVSFNLGYNLLRDDASFISSFTNCTNLEILVVISNMITGSLPNSISNLSTRLNLLHLGANEIHGDIPPAIENLVGLNSIYLGGNYLEGPIPEGIGQLSNLFVFHVYQNRLTKALPHSIGNLTSLTVLYLDDNNFLGNLPLSLANLTNLIDLDLSYNDFSGVIPPQIVESLASVAITLDLNNNHFEGSIPQEVGSLTNLALLALSENRFTGQIPLSLARCAVLQRLDLQGNLLQGEIPSALSALAALQVLDLSRNNLSGSIPRSLEKLKLGYLNLSFNALAGEVPRAGAFANQTAVFLDGNPRLCGGVLELNLPPCPRVESSRINKNHRSTLVIKLLIPLLAGSGVLGFSLLGFFLYKRRKPDRRDLTPPFPGVRFMRLSYADLLNATAGFSEQNLLGAGRFGSVYKGILGVEHDQTPVAVKVLHLLVKGASKSFAAECDALRGARHRNLLKILSVCESIDFQGNDFKALVYEFKSNGSLEQWLHRCRDDDGEEGDEGSKLSVMQRLNIAVDIAQAIKYLHLGTDSVIIHGDLKPSNILLDEDMSACVGDFGLAKIVSNMVLSHDSSSSSTMIRGTIGYVPPEYGMSNSISTQGDVYSFGIVLLEMFVNTKPTDDLFQDGSNLHDFVAASLPDRVMEIVDPSLFPAGFEITNEQMNYVASILTIGLSCSKEMPKDRTSIVDVVNELSMIHKLLSRRRR